MTPGLAIWQLEGDLLLGLLSRPTTAASSLGSTVRGSRIGARSYGSIGQPAYVLGLDATKGCLGGPNAEARRSPGKREAGQVQFYLTRHSLDKMGTAYKSGWELQRIASVSC